MGPPKRKRPRSEWRPEAEEIAELERRIKQESPRRGWHPVEAKTAAKFSSLPISERTLRGLEAGKYERMKPIQQATIPHALAGRDILGAAKTGSGKTLAFVVPVLEKLFRERWSPEDGLGALVVSPTRELAIQLFQVLRVAGSRHDLSAGCVTGGGRDVAAERARVGRMCVLAATPGRVLQHLEEAPSFDASRACVLVVDEADRAVDCGFAPQLEAIAAYLPTARQTLLFSATLAGSVTSSSKELRASPRIERLRGLCDARSVEFVVAARTDGDAPTPSALRQCYVVCELAAKLDLLFSFVKTHLRAKTIVFVSACAQARFVFEALRGLQPGVPLLALHGKLSQKKRTAVYHEFAAKQHAVLFATDVAARGLDFPRVDWVLQLDAPEDADAYVHRAGRAARNDAPGDALLVLLPSEEPRLTQLLRDARLPVDRQNVKPFRRATQPHVAALVAARPDVAALARAAFKSYVRSVALAADTQAFRVDALDLDAYAKSLGLAAPPTLRLPNPDRAADVRAATHASKNKNRKLHRLKTLIRAAKLAPAPTERPPEPPDDDPLLTLRSSDSPPRSADRLPADDRPPRPAAISLERRTKKRRKLKIRDAAAADNKTTFDDAGRPVLPETTTTTTTKTLADPRPPSPIDPDKLKASHDDFVARVRDRLRRSATIDRDAQRRSRRDHKLKLRHKRDTPSSSGADRPSAQLA